MGNETFSFCHTTPSPPARACTNGQGSRIRGMRSATSSNNLKLHRQRLNKRWVDGVNVVASHEEPWLPLTWLWSELRVKCNRMNHSRRTCRAVWFREKSPGCNAYIGACALCACFVQRWADTRQFIQNNFVWFRFTFRRFASSALQLDRARMSKRAYFVSIRHRQRDRAPWRESENVRCTAILVDHTNVKEFVFVLTVGSDRISR